MPVQVTYDSELMEQLLPADPVPASRRFAVILDENRRPLVISIGNDNILYLVIADENGTNQRQNLGARLGFNTAAQAFGVAQREDGTFVLVFAMQHANDSYGDVRILGPLKPADLRKEDIVLRSYMLRTEKQPTGLIFERILIGPLTNSLNPLIIAVHRNQKDTDIARLELSAAGGTLTWRNNLDLPQNATYGSLTDLVPGEPVWGKGVFYLYKAGGQQSLVFITSEPGSDGSFYRVSLGIPANQEFISLGTFTDQTGQSRLLASGAWGLYQYKTIRNGAPPTLISNDPLYSGVSNLFVAQSGNDVSVWFKNGDQTLAYQRGNSAVDTLVNSSQPPVPLTNPGQGAQFAAIIDPNSKSQRLLVTNSAGFLTLKEQAIESNLWKDTPFVVPHLEKNITIKSYTIAVKFVGSDGQPFANKEILLASSGWVSVTIDGKQLTVTSVGIPVRTDAKGTLTIIVPTTDVSSYTFSIKDHGGSNDFPSPISIDPSTKVVDKLKGMSADKLLGAKDADGKPLIGSNIPRGDVDAAAKALADMHDVAKDLSAQTSSTPATLALAQSAAVTTSTAKSLDDYLWSAWNWVEEKIKSAVNWVIKKVGQAWRFIVTIAGKVWDFILDTATRVMKAVQFVFEKIGVAFEKLIQWIGFIFKWGDILEVSDGITSMVNGMLDFGAGFIRKGAVEVDKFFDGLEANIREMTNVAPSLKETSADQSQHDDKTSNSAIDSAPAKWSNYQLDHNGVKDNLRPVKRADGDPSLDFIWTDLVQPIWEDVKTRATGVVKQLTEIYRTNPGADLGDVLKVVGVEILLALLGLVKNLASGLIRVGAAIIEQVRKILNQEMKVPVLGALFKLISGGRPLTLLNAISLLIAVPVTILCKVVTNEKPKRITGFDYDRLVAGTLDKQTLLAYNELADWVTTVYYLVNGIVEIYKIMTYQIPEVPDSPTSPTVLSILMKLVLCAFTFPYDREAPRWPVRVSIWGVKAGNILVGGALQRLGPSVKAVVAFDIVAGLIAFSLATVVCDGEVTETSWKGRDAVSTGLRMALSILDVVSSSASGWGQLAPDPIEKGIATIVVGASAGVSSGVKGALKARAIQNAT